MNLNDAFDKAIATICNEAATAGLRPGGRSIGLTGRKAAINAELNGIRGIGGVRQISVARLVALGLTIDEIRDGVNADARYRLIADRYRHPGTVARRS